MDRSKGNLRKIYLKKSIGIPKKVETYTEKAEHNNKKNNKTNIDINIDEKIVTIEKVKDLWNNMFKNSSIPNISNIRNTRLRAMKARIKEHSDIGFWEEYLCKIKSSDFLSGASSEWRVNIDWVLSPSNMDKILDGNYDDQKEKKKKPTQEQIDKANAFRELEAKYTRESK